MANEYVPLTLPECYDGLHVISHDPEYNGRLAVITRIYQEGHPQDKEFIWNKLVHITFEDDPNGSAWVFPVTLEATTPPPPP